MQLVDTHCHIHEILGQPGKPDAVHERWAKAGLTDADRVIADAGADGVAKLLCVGTDVEDSELAVDFVKTRENTWASIGIHPHEAKRYVGNDEALRRFAALAERPKVAAVGECGLDFYYNHSDAADQEAILRFQIELAQKHGLPLSFHVRDAFEQFWRIFDEYHMTGKPVKGVIHSFTADSKVLEQALSRGLYVGLNGIMTFTKDDGQLAAAKAAPIDKIVLETDAPFLTPVPYRGKICEPKYVRVTLEFLADLRNEDVRQLADSTTANAEHLFALQA